MVNGKYISDFLLSGKTQQKGQLVYLNGVSKSKNDNRWSSGTLQVCDSNLLAWRCMGGTMVYFS